MNEQKKEFGARVRTMREARTWSQEELAHRIGRSVFTVSSIERGKGLPTVDTLAALVKALDISAEELLAVFWKEED